MFKCSLKNHFMLTYRSNEFLVTFWKFIRIHVVSPRWLDNASWPWMLVTSKAVFLKNYLAVSTWILNGSSIECLKKKYQPFSFAGARFGSWVNQISQLKSACRRSGLCCYVSAATSEFQETRRIIKQIYRLNVSLSMPRSQSWLYN